MIETSRIHLMRLAAAAFLGWGTISVASAADAPARQAQADVIATESLRDWQYFTEVPLTAKGNSPSYDLILTPSVFDAARLDLADLRLYDAAGSEIPYA